MAVVSTVQRVQIAILTVVVTFAAFYFFAQYQRGAYPNLFPKAVERMYLDNVPMIVEIANTDAARTKGLSGREDFTTAGGLLFIFDKPDYYGIWMKDMYFPIDIIWIAEDLTIVGIETDVLPNSYPRIYRPPKPVRYVVETNSRYTETYGIDVGGKVLLP